MNVPDTKFMAAREGSIIVNDTTKKDTNFYGCELAKGTIVSQLLDQDGNDVTTTYITTPGSALKKDSLITFIGDGYFSSITLGTAGQADLVLKKTP